MSEEKDRITVPAADESTGLQAVQPPTWHAPVITRIEIKRTLSCGGSATDGMMGSLT